MLKASFGNLLRPVLLFIIFVFILVALFVGIYKFITRNDYNTYINLKSPLPTPQISGWIPWWEEKRGYDLVKKYSAKINTVSPVWFMVDKNLKLIEVGRVDKKLAVTELKALNIKICPTLGSELSREEMSVFLNNKKATNELVKDLADEIVPLGVDGVDIDLEGMKKEDSDKFSSFLLLMSKRLKEKKLKMSVSVHAQTGKVFWYGAEGQDLKTIGKIADEIRIMAYDEHSPGSNSGAISSFNWIKDIANHNLTVIEKDKIVIGIPTYGYVWTKDDSKGLQFYEFNKYLEKKQYEEKRDPESGERIIKGQDFVAWLSDSQAMAAKINLLRSLGFNRFIFWHLGGMDEKLFDESWQK